MITQSQFRRIALIFILIMALFIGITIYSRGHSITVTTDTVPIKLQLNDKTYVITSNKKSIRLPSDIYNYRAIATVDGKRIAQINKFDLQDNRHYDLKLSFSIYNNASLVSAVCEGEGNDCPVSTGEISSVFVENYQWAVVISHTQDLGNAAAVLNIQSGRWVVLDGPGTSLSGQGNYPESVEEVLIQYGF